jgi:hypothetical protein
MHHGGRHAVAERLGLRCKRPAPGMAAGATAEGLAAQLLKFMTDHQPEQLLLDKSSSNTSSSGEALDGSSIGGGDAQINSPADSSSSSSISSDSSTRGASGAERGSSSSSSSIGRSRLAKVRWRQLPTQRQLLAAGRSDLVAGLQKYGHDRIRRRLGLPAPERKQLRKVGDCVVWKRMGCLL